MKHKEITWSVLVIILMNDEGSEGPSLKFAHFIGSESFCVVLLSRLFGEFTESLYFCNDIYRIMKQTYLFLLALLLASCSPRVVTDMLTNEWPATKPDSVYVFHKNDHIPTGSQEIGKVKVVDTGFSLHGSFNQVMQKAINATAEKGGNGLVITEHRWPDGRSTIHRIWGTMLHIPESAFAESETPDTMEYSALKQILTEDEYAEFMEYRATKQFYEEQEKEYEEKLQRQQELLKVVPHNVLRLSVGPSFMTSKYQIGNREYKNRAGLDVCIDYDHFWKAIGLGINYLHNYTSFDGGIKTRLDYIGPSYVLAITTSKTFRFDYAIGLGYCHYSESLDKYSISQNRLGYMMRVGAEWRVAKSLALGAQINYFSVRLKKPEGLELKDNETYGISHIGLLAGLRYYF